MDGHAVSRQSQAIFSRARRARRRPAHRRAWLDRHRRTPACP